MKSISYFTFATIVLLTSTTSFVIGDKDIIKQECRNYCHFMSNGDSNLSSHCKKTVCRHCNGGEETPVGAELAPACTCLWLMEYGQPYGRCVERHNAFLNDQNKDKQTHQDIDLRDEEETPKRKNLRILAFA